MTMLYCVSPLLSCCLSLSQFTWWERGKPQRQGWSSLSGLTVVQFHLVVNVMGITILFFLLLIDHSNSMLLTERLLSSIYLIPGQCVECTACRPLISKPNYVPGCLHCLSLVAPLLDVLITLYECMSPILVSLFISPPAL